MNAVRKIEVPVFNALAAYERERAENRRLHGLLDRALILLNMETTRRELAGDDVAHIRGFISEARS